MQPWGGGGGEKAGSGTGVGSGMFSPESQNTTSNSEVPQSTSEVEEQEKLGDFFATYQIDQNLINNLLSNPETEEINLFKYRFSEWHTVNKRFLQNESYGWCVLPEIFTLGHDNLTGLCFYFFYDVNNNVLRFGFNSERHIVQEKMAEQRKLRDSTGNTNQPATPKTSPKETMAAKETFYEQVVIFCKQEENKQAIKQILVEQEKKLPVEQEKLPNEAFLRLEGRLIGVLSDFAFVENDSDVQGYVRLDDTEFGAGNKCFCFYRNVDGEFRICFGTEQQVKDFLNDLPAAKQRLREEAELYERRKAFLESMRYNLRILDEDEDIVVTSLKEPVIDDDSDKEGRGLFEKMGNVFDGSEYKQPTLYRWQEPVFLEDFDINEYRPRTSTGPGPGTPSNQGKMSPTGGQPSEVSQPEPTEAPVPESVPTPTPTPESLSVPEPVSFEPPEIDPNKPLLERIALELQRNPEIKNFFEPTRLNVMKIVFKRWRHEKYKLDSKEYKELANKISTELNLITEITRIIYKALTQENLHNELNTFFDSNPDKDFFDIYIYGNESAPSNSFFRIRKLSSPSDYTNGQNSSWIIDLEASYSQNNDNFSFDTIKDFESSYYRQDFRVLRGEIEKMTAESGIDTLFFAEKKVQHLFRNLVFYQNNVGIFSGIYNNDILSKQFTQREWQLFTDIIAKITAFLSKNPFILISSDFYFYVGPVKYNLLQTQVPIVIGKDKLSIRALGLEPNPTPNLTSNDLYFYNDELEVDDAKLESSRKKAEEVLQARSEFIQEIRDAVEAELHEFNSNNQAGTREWHVERIDFIKGKILEKIKELIKDRSRWAKYHEMFFTPDGCFDHKKEHGITQPYDGLIQLYAFGFKCVIDCYVFDLSVDESYLPSFTERVESEGNSWLKIPGSVRIECLFENQPEYSAFAFNEYIELALVQRGLAEKIKTYGLTPQLIQYEINEILREDKKFIQNFQLLLKEGPTGEDIAQFVVDINGYKFHFSWTPQTTNNETEDYYVPAVTVSLEEGQTLPEIEKPIIKDIYEDINVFKTVHTLLENILKTVVSQDESVSNISSLEEELLALLKDEKFHHFFSKAGSVYFGVGEERMVLSWDNTFDKLPSDSLPPITVKVERSIYRDFSNSTSLANYILQDGYQSIRDSEKQAPSNVDQDISEPNPDLSTFKTYLEQLFVSDQLAQGQLEIAKKLTDLLYLAKDKITDSNGDDTGYYQLLTRGNRVALKQAIIEYIKSVDRELFDKLNQQDGTITCVLAGKEVVISWKAENQETKADGIEMQSFSVQFKSQE